jgi:hypothetical protein
MRHYNDVQHGRNEMPGKDKPGPSIKNEDTYEALKDEGYSKSRAAAISNQAAKGPAARSAMAKKAAKSRDKGTARKRS